MSVTAFPVLARIMQERGLHRSRIGTIAITCAAADDITAWSLLAVIIAIVKAGSFVSALYTIGLALLYVAAMIRIVKPFLARVGKLHPGHVNIIPEYILDSDIYGRHDLMMLSVDGWKHFTEAATPGLQFLPSVLILSYKG